MAVIEYEGATFHCSDSENLLSELIRQGADILFSCRNGICQSCMLKYKGGAPIPELATAGLKETWRNEGYFLPCLCPVPGDLTISRISNPGIIQRAVVVDKTFLATGICAIRLDTEKSFEYHSGQFINVRRVNTGLIRSYSLASVPSLDSSLEIHVKRLENGVMSNWMCDEVASGEVVQLIGPHGASYYLPGRPSQRMLLVATGTGLAPLCGIVRSALAAGHAGRIDLYHGSRHSEGLYLCNELREMVSRYNNFHYHPCVSGSTTREGHRHGRADDTAFAENADLTGVRVFLCGAPPMVQSAKRLAYLAGASLADIFADPFELRDLRSKTRTDPDPGKIGLPQKALTV